MKRILMSLILCIIVLISGCTDVNIYKSQRGLLDLSDLPFDDRNIYKMQGEWKIAWNRFLDPLSDRDEIDALSTYVSLPQSWTNQEIGSKKIGSQGFGTLIMNIKTGETFEKLAIQSTYLASAFEVYANGVLIASNGITGDTKESTRAAWHPVVGGIDSKSEDIQLLIHFSNFNHRRFIAKDFYLGSYDAIQSHKNSRLYMDLLAIGSISIMGLYHLMLYSLRKKDRSSFYFSMICFCFSLRTLLIGDRLIYEIFPNINWELFMKLSYITFFLPTIFIILFVENAFPSLIHKIVRNSIAVLTVLATSATLLLPAKLFDIILVPFEAIVFACCLYLLFVFISAMRQGRQGSKTMVFSFIVILFATVNDIMYENGSIETTTLISFALIVLIYSQSYILAKRFTNAYQSFENLLEENKRINKALHEQNENLEETIKQRTFEIIEINKKLNHLASTDALTGLYNRRVFSERLDETSSGSYLAIIDIDDFKKVNDTYGHDTGDLVLQKLSDILTTLCPCSSFVSRIGGEEFAIIFAPESSCQVNEITENIRDTIARTTILNCGHKIRCSVSMGLCEFSQNTAPPEVFKQADLALYQAKENGKNQVCYS